MRKILTSCALCVVALSASAQCAISAQAQPAQPAPTAQQHKGSGWMNTASAGTAEAPPAQGTRTAMQTADASAAQPKQESTPDHEHRRRTGPAMLIAALAVMSAIALRRLGGSNS